MASEISKLSIDSGQEDNGKLSYLIIRVGALDYRASLLVDSLPQELTSSIIGGRIKMLGQQDQYSL